ncbi:hypothetical protein L7F22_021792 [Adiantum nelumboides]|nr:hypothetical protein [Adiantum nelumboides]
MEWCAGGEDAREGDIKNVASELRRAFSSGTTRSLHWRQAQLDALLCLLCEREEELCHALALDLGKSSHDAMVSEIVFLRNNCKLAKKNLKKWASPKKVSVPIVALPTYAAVVAEPLGVVLVISPWNFPLVLALDPMIGALSAGNAVVLKPSEVSQFTSEVLAKLIPMYLDTTAIRVVEGGIAESTVLLEQKWDKIFFTAGSSTVGKVVMSAAAKHLTPVVLELGGKCPVLVDATADLDVTAKRLAFGKWNSSYGQACIAPDYVLVEASIAAQLVAKLKKVLENFYGEDARLSKDHCRVVNQKQLERLRGFLDEDLVRATVVLGGEVDEPTLYMAPTILLNPSLDSAVMKEEIFGPILPIVESMDSAIEFVKTRPSPLAVYIFTKSKSHHEKAVGTIQAGSVVINEVALQFMLEGLPFGGVGESGFGSYHGKDSFDTFSHPKAILIRRFLLDVPLRYPPFTEYKKRILRRIVEYDNIGALLALLGLRRDDKSIIKKKN